MRKAIAIVLGLVFFNACIPLRIAPTISDYKLTEGKRFKKGLPEKTVFAFEDPKDAEAFYNYINIKYQLEDYYVDVEVPFKIDDNEYFLSFYEVEIPDKSLNLLTMAVDVALVASDSEPILSDSYATRDGNWYIAIEVFSATEKDCLHENSPSRAEVLSYLRAIKEEYLSTHNYNETLFKN